MLAVGEEMGGGGEEQIVSTTKEVWHSLQFYPHELFMYVRSGQRVTMHIKRVFATNFVG
jgi:hypothetical protein